MNQTPKLISYRVMLHETFGNKFRLVFDCQAVDADDAEDQAEKAYPGSNIISVTPFDNSPLDFVILYESEGGDQYWSNTESWVELPHASRFTHEESKIFNLPITSGKNPKWVLYTEAIASYCNEIRRSQIENLTPDSDVDFARSESIKAEYVASGCQASDADNAVQRLMAECGELFFDEDAAWTFLTAESEDNVQIRLSFDVKYKLNGVSSTEMKSRLEELCQFAIENGMLTGSTEAEIEDYSISVKSLTPPLSEEVLTDFMRARIENGHLLSEDVPVRLARYGLMDPNAFVLEMRERMESAEDE